MTVSTFDSKLPTVLLIDNNGSAHDVTYAVTGMALNYTIDAGADLQIDLFDEQKQMMSKNYFQLGSLFVVNTGTTAYGLEAFILVEISISDGEAFGANVKLNFRDKIFHEMKNDFSPQNLRAANGYDFAAKVAKKFGLRFIGQKVKGKQSVIKVKTKNNRDSVWKVLSDAANQNQYVCFIANDTLFFGSPKFLLGQWGIDSVESIGDSRPTTSYPKTPAPVVKGNIDVNRRPLASYKGNTATVRSIHFREGALYVLIPTVLEPGIVVSNEVALQNYRKTGKHLGKFRTSADATLFAKNLHALQAKWVEEISSQMKTIYYIPLIYPTPSTENRFFLTGMPDMKKSIESIKEGEGSCNIFGPSARNLRAGMTVILRGMNQFNGEYIITSVDYALGEPEPVKINFANVSKMAPEDKAKVEKKIAEVTVISGTGK